MMDVPQWAVLWIVMAPAFVGMAALLGWMIWEDYVRSCICVRNKERDQARAAAYRREKPHLPPWSINYGFHNGRCPRKERTQ